MLTKEAVNRVLGPTGDTLAVQLIATGATEEELREAHFWVLNDETFINEGRHMPTGRIAALMEILRDLEGP